MKDQAAYIRTMRGFSTIQQLGFWSLFFGSVIIMTQNELTLPGAITRGLIVGSIYAVNFYICFLILAPRYFEKKKYLEFIFYILLLQVSVGMCRYLADAYLLQQFSSFRLIDSRYKALILMMVVNIAVSSFSVMLRLSISRLEYEHMYLEKEKEQITTELQFLKSQIHPHFLFNTLNNLYTLIIQKSDRASDALLRLSDLLRYLLYECEAAEVPIAKETGALSSFILLHQLKYANPVQVTMDMRQIPEHISIQPMLLIPLLENAFKYSDIGYNDQAYIHIEFDIEQGLLVFHIRNSVDRSIAPSASAVGGIGIKNLRRRLELTSSGLSSLTINEGADYFDVLLKLPV